jgi:asparagine synthase (glutamine-hydrolysing)
MTALPRTPDAPFEPSRRPYFKATRGAGRWITSGSPSGSFGRRIDRPGHTDPDGTFAGWHWDGDCLRAEIDYLGVYPLYYHADSDRFLISDSIMTLLANGAPADLDWESLAVFFWWGGLIGNDTPFSSIRILPSAGTLEWREGRLTVRSRDIQVTETRMTRDAAIDGFIDLVAAAVGDRIDERSMVPLSGGRDSRHLLFRLVEAGFPPDLCVTAGYGVPNDFDETEIAREVARRMGVPHQTVQDAPCRIRAERVKNTAIGFTSAMHYWYESIVRVGLDADIRTIYDGLQLLPFAHTGWSETTRLQHFAAGRFETIAEDWINPEGRGTNTWMHFLAPEHRERIAPDIAVSRLARELERYGQWPNPLGAFLALNRTRRSVGNQLYNFWPATVAVHCPFIDRRLFDHLLSLPPAITMEGDLHSDAIHRAFPQYADIPFAGPVKPRRDLRKQMATARTLLWLLVRTGSGPLLDSGHVIPRVLRSSIDPRYAPNIDWLAKMIVYAWQLGHISELSASEMSVTEVV